MELVKYHFLINVFLFISLCLNAQSIETGFVKEYNGEKAKTPLAGVELSVSGAPSTISDVQGYYELKFAVLKPGEAIKYNEIYKSGYVIFNKDALGYWRISNTSKPFVIVMCKESAFRDLKKKYYGIIERSYRNEYLKQKDIAEKTAQNAASLQTQLMKLKKEYDEKISNINTYVELFARIDRSEMDSVVSRALTLIEAGKIDEGIKVYEELELSKQVAGQIDKWKSGEKMLQVAKTMISDSQQDLIMLTEKVKQQIGLYEMGGSDYNERRKEMTASLIEILRKLNLAFPNHYNEELGMWICRYADFTKLNWATRKNDYREAASLPSWHGMTSLARFFEFFAFDNFEFVDSARTYYQEARKLADTDSIKKIIDNHLLWCADFNLVSECGDTLFYKFYGGNDSVYVWPKTEECYNKVSGTLTIPENVVYGRKRYKVGGIGPYAFFKNKRLKKVVLPKGLHHIYNNAFEKCDLLDTLVVNQDLLSVGDKAIPASAYLENMKHINIDNLWAYNHVKDRFETIANNKNKRFYSPTRKLLIELSEKKDLEKEYRAYFMACIGILELQYGDTIGSLKYFLDANSLIENKYNMEIGTIYSWLKQYPKAYDFFMKAKETSPAAYNSLAYMYAEGQYVVQDYKIAMEMIDKAIALLPNEEGFVDTKGEIYLMMGERDSAMAYANKVLEMNPKFDTPHSDLFKTLYRNRVDSINAEKKWRQGFYDIVRLAANYLYDSQMQAYTEFDYDEIVSIGVLGINALLNRKTQEQTNKYNVAYIGAAVLWAIRNELRIRYNWYWPVYYGQQGLDEDVYEEEFTEEERKQDTKKFKTRIAVYKVILALYEEIKKELNNEGAIINSKFDFINDVSMEEFVNSPQINELRQMGKIVSLAISKLPEKKQQMVITDLIHGTKYNKIKEKYNVSLVDINSILYATKEYLDMHMQSLPSN